MFGLTHNHCFCCNTEEGHVFVWGYGILGKGPNLLETALPEMIPPTLFGLTEFNPHIQVSQIRCGLSHFAALTSKLPCWAARPNWDSSQLLSSTYIHLWPFIFSPIFLSVLPSILLSIYICPFLSILLFIHPLSSLFLHLSFCLSVRPID